MVLVIIWWSRFKRKNSKRCGFMRLSRDWVGVMKRRGKRIKIKKNVWFGHRSVGYNMKEWAKLKATEQRSSNLASVFLNKKIIKKKTLAFMLDNWIINLLKSCNWFLMSVRTIPYYTFDATLFFKYNCFVNVSHIYIFSIHKEKPCWTRYTLMVQRSNW